MFEIIWDHAFGGTSIYVIWTASLVRLCCDPRSEISNSVVDGASSNDIKLGCALCKRCHSAIEIKTAVSFPHKVIIYGTWVMLTCKSSLK